MSDTLSANLNNCSSATDDPNRSTPPAPALPLDDFAAELVEAGLSREQAVAFLETLIPLMWHFVDLGFRGDISELFLSPSEPVAVEFDTSAKTEMPAKSQKETAAE